MVRGIQERRKGAVHKRQEVMHKARRKQEMKEWVERKPCKLNDEEKPYILTEASVEVRLMSS